MNLVIRADASKSSGVGHVMRSSAVAEEMISRGWKVDYVSDVQQVSWLEKHLNSIGVNQIYHPSNASLRPNIEDILLLDSYSIPKTDSFLNRNKWKRVVVIGDSQTPSYENDLRINVSLTDHTESENHLSGPKYALIRKGITKNHRLLPKHGTLKVLIVAGGTDPSEFHQAVLKIVSDFDLDLKFLVYSNSEEALQLRKWNHPVEWHSFGTSMDLVCQEIDVAITLASTLSIEMIAREIPQAIGSAFGNQHDGYLQLAQLGLATPIGTFERSWNINEPSLFQFLSNRDTLRELKRKMIGLIDMMGPARIGDKIEKMRTSPR
jgi:spore coat polysaccharide biosynthesis predicted glycosyltransferase SpsG